MQAPCKPSEEDCCHSGCNPCVFDVYEKQMKIYEKNKNANFVNCDNFILNGISEIEYTKFVVMDIVKICCSVIIIKFKKMCHDNCNIWWKPGDHFLLKYSFNDFTCSRQYTPIRLKNNSYEDYDFLVVVKKYNEGVVSNYLFNLKIGDDTLWRGPYGFYEREPDKYSRIIMIAQGTGIAPFLSIIDNILNSEDDMTIIILLFCCKNIEEILFRNVLYEYRSYWNFTYSVFLSSENKDVLKIAKYEEPLVEEKFNMKYLDIYKLLSTDQILLCGSKEFMDEYKKCLLNTSANIVLF